MKPIEGAETGGAVGFFKGVGKGLVGFVITSQHLGYNYSLRPISKQCRHKARGRRIRSCVERQRRYAVITSAVALLSHS